MTKFTTKKKKNPKKKKGKEKVKQSLLSDNMIKYEENSKEVPKY